MSSFSVFFSSAAADVARSPPSLAPPTSHLRARPPISFSAMCSLPSMPLIIRFLCFVFSEILRVTTLLGNASFLDQSGLEHASSLALGGIFSNGGANVNRWASPFQSKMSGLLQPSSAQNRLGSQGSSSGLIVKRTMRVDITVDQYPNFNFVGRLLGPRGNSLKRVEASAECRVLIKGHGSIKDPVKWLSIRKDENEFGPFSAWNITGTCTGVQVSHSTGCLWPY